MKKTIELNENETYLVYNKDASIIIFEPVEETKVDGKFIVPAERTSNNLLASNIAIALLQKIKTESSFVTELLNWFHKICIPTENNTIH